MKIFDSQNRIGRDECSTTSENQYNTDISNYMLYNSYPTNQQQTTESCEPFVKKLNEFATDNYMNIRDGVGFTNGCKVDTDSELRMYNMTTDRSRTQLLSRVFQASPNLAMGGQKIELESKLSQGENTFNDSECRGTVLDVFMPMLPCLEKSVQNTEHIIPSWVRGGDSTRDTVRQNEFLKKNGYSFDGKVWLKKQM
jgi:hypothetical protein